MGSSVRLFRHFSSYSDVFVETGTHSGAGIERALRAGYTTIYSCDVNVQFVEAARKRFSERDVRLVAQPSVTALESICAEISSPAVFLLDAHAMPPTAFDEFFAPSTLMPGYESSTELQVPPMTELQIILESTCDNHVILIDDLQCFGTRMFNGLVRSDLERYVLSHRPSMTIGEYGNVLVLAPDNLGIPRQPLLRMLADKARRWRGRVGLLRR